MFIHLPLSPGLYPDNNDFNLEMALFFFYYCLALILFHSNYLAK